MTNNLTRLSLLVAAALFFSSALPNPAPAQTVSFVARKDFAAGAFPQSVVVGDFNGDGRPDLAVATDGSVSVLLGNGDGTFPAPLTFAVGTGPSSVAVGDFNGDGKLDLAVANKGSNDVSVLLGTGDGTFQAPLTFAAGTTPVTVAVGDFNGDGKLDLAVANGGGVSVLLGNGDGTFQAAQNFAAGGLPQSVVVGDFNGDGRPDLAVATDGGVSVLLGNGDGTFQPARTFAVFFGGFQSSPRLIAVGDFNGDGVQDLAVAIKGFHGHGDVSVHLGIGDGTFRAALYLNTRGSPWFITVADFNGDGVQDLAVAIYETDNMICPCEYTQSWLGNGDGTFTRRAAVYVPFPQSIAVGDLNSDGQPDLAVANQDTVSVLLGTGDGTFQAAPTYDIACCRAHSLAVGDFNDDGMQDLAVASGGGVSVLLGTGDGTFQAAPSFAAGTSPYSLAVSDFNGDGLRDLAVANLGSNDVSVLLGNGDGTFQAAQSFAAGTSPYSLAVGDLNGDGRPDLAVANYGSYPTWEGTVSVLLGIGDGTFQAAQSFAAGTNPYFLAMGDLNGDGRLDLAVANGSNHSNGDPGHVSVLLGNGDGTFQAAQNFAAGDGPESVAIGDLNGDGRLDLAVANFWSNTVSVLLGNGDGTFLPALPFGVGSYPTSVAMGDFNGDGVQDLAVATRGGVSVLLGNGDGTFPAALTFGAGDTPQSVAVGDFNGDAKLDLAVDNFFSNNVSVLINNTAFATNTLTVSKAGTGSGTVTSSESPPKIDCGTTCSASYDRGTVVTLTATPALGSTFTGWSGCDMVSGTSCTVAMNAARSVTASFLGNPPILPPLF